MVEQGLLSRGFLLQAGEDRGVHGPLGHQVVDDDGVALPGAGEALVGLLILLQRPRRRGPDHGVAAVLKSYFPKLTYTDIKRIIRESATPYQTPVRRPESTDTVPFASLSKTGGIVNLYDAVKMALAQESGVEAKGK